MLLSVSVDLDEIERYDAIHGVAAGAHRGQVYSLAVPRIVDWARQRGVALTWFVVGRDLALEQNSETVGRLAQAGDEVACHSHSHHYDLTRRSFSQMRAEVELGVAAIQRVVKGAVAGFRAPGYVVTDVLLDLLRESGFAYDSSVFPCPSYYALKLGALGLAAARARRSAAIVDVPEVLRAPTVPYRVGRPYWFRGTGIMEIPIQVASRARLPFIGTALTMAGPTGARLLARSVVGQPLVNLELHGIDLLDQGDGLQGLVKHQPDLRIPWSKKLDAIDAAVTLLQGKGYGFARMHELAERARA